MSCKKHQQLPKDLLGPVHTGDEVDTVKSQQIANFRLCRWSVIDLSKVDCLRLVRIRQFVTVDAAAKGPVHTGNKVESDTVNFVELSTKSTVSNSTLSPVCTGL